MVDLDNIDKLNIEGETGEVVDSAVAAVAAVRRAVVTHDTQQGAAMGSDQHSTAASAAAAVATAAHHHPRLSRQQQSSGQSQQQEYPVGPRSRHGELLSTEATGRNVRRRTAEGSQSGEQSGVHHGLAARDDDGADADGRRVRRREAAEPGGDEGHHVLEWIREPSWMPEWMPRLPPLGREGPDDQEHGRARPADDPLVQSTGAAQADAAPRADGLARSGHSLRITGSLVWCSRCAAYASRRWGVRLRGACRPGTGDATRSRLELLAQGRHPITGVQLV